MLSERLRTLLAERNMGIAEFAELCDLPMDTVRNIYYGKSVDPKLSTMTKMAEALNLSINCLLGKCAHTSTEKLLLRNYRECGPRGKSVIELVAKYEASAVKKERESKGKHQIPCLVPRGDIRQGIIYDNCEAKEIVVSDEEAYVAIEMTTNDLAPIYCRGDHILIANRFPKDGEYAAFFKEEKAYIRKFFEEKGKYRLKSLHAHGSDIILSRMDEVEYIGVCIGATRN